MLFDRVYTLCTQVEQEHCMLSGASGLGDSGKRARDNMMQSNEEYSTPIHPEHTEERIQIADGAGLHVNDVLCGRGKLSFNHSEYCHATEQRR
jgi:hypothetical protein